MRGPRGLNAVFVRTTTPVMMAASAKNPEPVNAPTAAEHHSVAAVSIPLIFNPSLIMTPAPRNPMPETT
jgi:hypothetical protein